MLAPSPGISIFERFPMTLTRRIEQSLKAHVLAGEPPPYPLTLTGIAGHFGVSVMPARAAVDALVRERFLVQQDNRRLAFNPRRRAKSRPSLAEAESAITLPEKTVEDFVIDLSLRGRDIFLREEAAARRFGIGRTVVRRIFGSLAGRGMLEHVPRCGWRVHAFRQQDMLDFLDVRETLELRALELARPRLDDARLEQLLEGNTPDAEGRPRLDNRLHRYWIDLADNRYVRQFFAQNGIYFQALFDRAVLDDSIVAQRAAEHRAILAALLQCDWALANRELSRHIRGQRAHVARLFAELGATAGPGESTA
jgi:DNA-binding GntR family transcriptional regulator